MHLQSLGWNPFFAAQISTENCARIAAVQGDRYTLHDGLNESTAVARGSLRNDPNAPPAVGDWVTFSISANTAVIERILDRRTLIARKRAGTGVSAQALAANIDRVIIVMSLDADFSLHRLERYLTLTWDSGATPIVALTKTDLAGDFSSELVQVEQRTIGFPVIPLGYDDHSGLHRLEAELLAAQTIVLLGSSGAGKSTLINRLAGTELRRTGTVRASDGTGRHTTTDRQLLRLPSGVLVIDTPGLREVQLWAEEDSLEETFFEITNVARGCRFGDCTHTSEPHCAVQGAVQSGEIDPERFASFVKLRAELAYLHRQTDVAAAQQHKSKMKGLMKMQKEIYRTRKKP